MVALAHKMLRTLYVMLAKATHYQDRSVDHEALEALNVARNAPRWIKKCSLAKK